MRRRNAHLRGAAAVSRRGCLLRIVPGGAAAVGAPVGSVYENAIWPAGLRRCLADRRAARCVAASLRFTAGQRGNSIRTC
jgi:hypothetical protein